MSNSIIVPYIRFDNDIQDQLFICCNEMLIFASTNLDKLVEVY